MKSAQSRKMKGGTRPPDAFSGFTPDLKDSIGRRTGHFVTIGHHTNPSGGRVPPEARSANGGFTLLELLVVIGLIAALAAVLVGGLGGGGRGAAVQSGQATMTALITAARTRAAATGRKTRLLVGADPASATRYLRHAVLQLAREPGASPADWDTLVEVDLPDGVYIAPPSLTAMGGLVASVAEWKRTTDPSAELASDLFQNQAVPVALPGDATAEAWMGIAFTPNGTLAGIGAGLPPKGYLVVAAGIPRPPGSYPPGGSPVQLIKPGAVRGIVLSAYGIPALLNERSAF
jgi:prepilin-type N-terminal cleavage/methylation domain-containing protein